MKGYKGSAIPVNDEWAICFGVEAPPPELHCHPLVLCVGFVNSYYHTLSHVLSFDGYVPDGPGGSCKATWHLSASRSLFGGPHAAWSAAVLSDVPRKSFLSKAHCLRGTKIGEVPRKAASRVPSPLDLKSLMCTDPGSETCALLCDVAAGDEGWMKEPPTIQLQPQVVACYTCNQNQQ